MGKIVLYKGQFQYDAANCFVDQLAAGFKQLNKPVEIIDLRDQTALPARLQAVFSSTVDLVIALDASGYNAAKINGQFLTDALNIPLLSLLIDHPVYCLDRFHCRLLTNTCFDRTHLAFFNEWNQNRFQSFFLPHAGCQTATPTQLTGANRHISILYPASFLDPQSCYKQISALDKATKKRFLDAADLLLATHNLPVEQALKEVLKRDGITCPFSDPFYRTIFKHFPLLDCYHRGKKRLEILNFFDKNGIAINIYGNNWPANKFKHHHVHTALPFKEILNLMQQAKFVLSTAMVPDGSHERIFSAMLNGAVPLCDYTPFNEECLAVENAVYYRWPNLDALLEHFNDLNSDADKFQQVISNNYQNAINNHTWKHRAEQILNTLSLNPAS